MPAGIAWYLDVFASLQYGKCTLDYANASAQYVVFTYLGIIVLCFVICMWLLKMQNDYMDKLKLMHTKPVTGSFYGPGHEHCPVEVSHLFT